MAMAKVWNDSDFEWNEKFKGEDVKIPARSFIEMEYYDAYSFKGQYSPITIDANDQQIKASEKRIRVEGAPAHMDKTTDIACQMCREKFLSFKTLNEHVMHSHPNDLVSNEEAEAEIAKKRRGPKPKSVTVEASHTDKA